MFSLIKLNNINRKIKLNLKYCLSLNMLKFLFNDEKNNNFYTKFETFVIKRSSYY